MLATLVALLLTLPLHAQNLPKTTIEKINGFEVHLVDAGRGDTFGVAFYVPFGTLYDTGHRMGRAHFLEHFVHNGSVRYPGYQTFKDMLKPAGVMTNAYTATDHTYYFASGKQENARLILNVHLAMLGGSERNPDTFGKEVNVVINEIDEERMPAENSAMSYMSLLHLLPKGHPWSKYPMHGNRENLSALTMGDMMDLYERYYTPTKVKVAVFGNFSRPGSLEEVREILKGALIPAPTAKPADADLVPSLFSTASGPAPESQTRLLVGAKELRQSSLTLELNIEHSNLIAATSGLLSAYLNLRTPGSLLHKLQTEKGWITNGGVYFIHFKNRLWLDFSYDPTETGMAHIEEIESYFFKALGELRQAGVPDATLASLKKAYRAGAERMGFVVQDLVQNYASVLQDQGSLADQVRDLEHVTNADIRRIAALAHPRRGLYATLTTDQTGMAEDTQFKRGYKKIAIDEALKKYEGSIFQGSFQPDENLTVRLVPVQLKSPDTREQRPMFVQSRPVADTPFRMALDFRSGLPDEAVKFSLATWPTGLEDLLNADLVLESFRQRYSGQISYLSLEYDTQLSLGRDKNVIYLSATSTTRHAARAVEWAADELSRFQPTGEEIRQAREALRTNLQNSYSGEFSAGLAVYASYERIDPYRMTPHTALQALDVVPTDNSIQNFRHLLESANKEAYVAGTTTSGEMEDIVRSIRVLSPKALSKEANAGLQSRFRNLATGSRTEAFPASRPGDGFGVVRVYTGPDVSDVKSVAALQVLASLLDNKVSTMNRDLLSLGYVHQAAARAIDKRRFYLVIYGQADGQAKAQQTVQGWETVLTSLRDGSIPDGDIQAAIADVLNTLSEEKTSAAQLIAEYEQNQQTFFNGRHHLRLIEALRKMTAADVRAIAEKFVTRDGVTYSQLTLGNCESLLKK